MAPLINLLEEEGLTSDTLAPILENFSGDTEFPGQIIELKSDLIPNFIWCLSLLSRLHV